MEEGAGESNTDERDPKIELDMSVTSDRRSEALFECFSKLKQRGNKCPNAKEIVKLK